MFVFVVEKKGRKKILVFTCNIGQVCSFGIGSRVKIHNQSRRRNRPWYSRTCDKQLENNLKQNVFEIHHMRTSKYHISLQLSKKLFQFQ